MRKPIRDVAFLTFALIALGAAACTGVGDAIGGSPSSGSPSLTPDRTDSQSVGPAGEGAATVRVKGEVDASNAFAGLGADSAWGAPPEAMTVQWLGAAGTSLSIGGRVFVGQKRTSPKLTVSFDVIDSGSTVSFISQSGECLVDIASADATHLGGAISCRDLESVGGSVSVTAKGRFAATAET
jgi:hypothetical protein